jgi:hypothetical protein
MALAGLELGIPASDRLQNPCPKPFGYCDRLLYIHFLQLRCILAHSIPVQSLFTDLLTDMRMTSDDLRNKHFYRKYRRTKRPSQSNHYEQSVQNTLSKLIIFLVTYCKRKCK